VKDPLKKPDQESTVIPTQAPLRRNSIVVPLTIFALLSIGLVVLMVARPRKSAQSGTEHQAVGRRLEKIELEPLTGDTDPIRSTDLIGKIVLMNYWGTWCPPCRVEFPHLMEIHNRLQNQKDFRFVSVSCGSENITSENFQESVEKLGTNTRAFLLESETTLPTHFDRFGSTRLAVQKASGIETFLYPTTVVLDRDGVVQAVWHGYEPGMEVKIESVLREQLKM
jgi:cytochrome c biogenesis protein CcmG/thiol:disulfide interchange protein DsbE